MGDFDFTREPGRDLKRPCLSRKVKALVSIITPFFNAGEHFEHTFNSVINQTFPFFEWIIVDDGSDEESARILRACASRDARITVLNNEGNKGPSAARNLAISRMQTEYIVTLDADDLIEPQYIECLYYGILSNPDYDWVYTDSLGFGEKEYVWRRPFNAGELKTFNFLTYSGLIRKSAVLDVGGYDERGTRIYEDWHLWLRLLTKGHYPVRQTWLGFWYRRSSTGVYNQVTSDEQKHKIASEYVSEAAKQLNEKRVRAREYSLMNGVGLFSKAAPEFPGEHEDMDRADEMTAAGTGTESEKHHILMIVPWLQMGGADRFNLELVKRLDRECFRVSIVTTKPDECPWRQLFAEYCDDIFELPTFLDMKDYPAFIEHIIRTRHTKTVFLSHSYYGYYLLPRLRMKFPELAITDYTHLEEMYWRGGGYARNSGAFSFVLDRTFTCCEATARVLTDKYGCDREKVKTVYIGTDSDVFKPGAELLTAENIGAAAAAGAKKAETVPDKKRTVLYPCRLSPQKRPFLMLEIARLVHEAEPDVRFLAVGDGPLLKNVMKKASAMGLDNTVIFAGAKTEMAGYYCNAALTLNCSVKEGLALTAYESLACGTPVVSADVGGQSELIDDSVGRLIPLMHGEDEHFNEDYADTAEAKLYADAVIALLADEEERKRLGANGIERIRSGYTVGHMVKVLEQEFTELSDEKYSAARRMQADDLKRVGPLTDEFLTLYDEYALSEEIGAAQFNMDTRNELMRIANSKLGRRLIKLAFKLKLNRIFR